MNAKPNETVGWWPGLQSLRDTDLHFTVVGGGGWMGLATLDILHDLLGAEAFEGRVVVLGSSDRLITLRPGLTVRSHALESWAGDIHEPSIVFHYAFLTRDKVGAMPMADYLSRNRDISERVADLVLKQRPRGVLLPSSGAVYARGGGLETDMEANPYGVLKVQDESTFARLCNELGASCVVPRIFALSGEYINKVGIYVLANAIMQLSEGEIVLRARGPVYRSYTYVGDLVSLAMAVMASEAPRIEVFDTAGEDILEIGDLARRVAEALGRPETPIRRDFDPTLPEDRYVGDRERLASLATSVGLAFTPLREQIQRTARYLLEQSS